MDIAVRRLNALHADRDVRRKGGRVVRGRIGTAAGAGLLILAMPAAYIAADLNVFWVSALVIAVSVSAGVWLAVRAKKRLDRRSP